MFSETRFNLLLQSSSRRLSGVTNDQSFKVHKTHSARRSCVRNEMLCRFNIYMQSSDQQMLYEPWFVKF